MARGARRRARGPLWPVLRPERGPCAAVAGMLALCQLVECDREQHVIGESAIGRRVGGVLYPAREACARPGPGERGLPGGRIVS